MIKRVSKAYNAIDTKPPNTQASAELRAYAAIELQQKRYSFTPTREVRKDKKMSQDDIAKKINVHGAVIGRYERDEVKPSIDVAAQIAQALEVSLDYLVGNTELLLDKTIIKRIVDIQKLEKEDKGHLFALMDAFLRDTKAKHAYK